MTDIIIEHCETVDEIVIFTAAIREREISVNKAKLARHYNVDIKTINSRLAGKLPATTRNRSKSLDAFSKLMGEILSDKYRSFDYISHFYHFMRREHQIPGCLSTFNRYIRSDSFLDNLFKRNSARIFTHRFETEPGEQAQFDCKERLKLVTLHGEVITVHVATLTLSHSRKNVRALLLDLTKDTIICFLAAAFEHLGGCVKELVIDNIKCLVDKARTPKQAPELNASFAQFLQDYNIKAIVCMAYRPQTKGKTETQNKVVNQLKNYNGHYADIHDMHEKLRIISREDNQRISQATLLPRDFLYSKEKDDMQPLPSKEIRKTYHLTLKSVTVGSDSYVNYKSRKYSVPKRYVGQNVGLRVINGELHIYYMQKPITIHKITNNLFNTRAEHDLTYYKPTAKLILNNEILIHEMAEINYDEV